MTNFELLTFNVIEWESHSRLIQGLVFHLCREILDTVQGTSLADSERVCREGVVRDVLIHFLSCCARGRYMFWDVSKRLVNGVNGFAVEEQDFK